LYIRVVKLLIRIVIQKCFFILAEDMLDLLMANKEWLEARPKADLSRRPEHTKTDELDMNGTFKKLQID